MKAIKITIFGNKFLLPDGVSAYKFPDYIIENKPLISELIEISNEMQKYMANPFCNEMYDLESRIKTLSNQRNEFKRKTDIIGFPFDMHDVDLYALDKDIEITLEVEL